MERRERQVRPEKPPTENCQHVPEASFSGLTGCLVQYSGLVERATDIFVMSSRRAAIASVTNTWLLFFPKNLLSAVCDVIRLMCSGNFWKFMTIPDSPSGSVSCSAVWGETELVVPRSEGEVWDRYPVSSCSRLRAYRDTSKSS